jgi:hypothetical protein
MEAAQGLDELNPNLLEEVCQLGLRYVKGEGITVKKGVTDLVKPFPCFAGDAAGSLASKTTF